MIFVSLIVLIFFKLIDVVLELLLIFLFGFSRNICTHIFHALAVHPFSIDSIHSLEQGPLIILLLAYVELRVDSFVNFTLFWYLCGEILVLDPWIAFLFDLFQFRRLIWFGTLVSFTLFGDIYFGFFLLDVMTH